MHRRESELNRIMTGKSLTKQRSMIYEEKITIPSPTSATTLVPTTLAWVGYTSF